jgi:EAL domain-containing protein (putative c-di-GMP-specific phosphodiesterase class I)
VEGIETKEQLDLMTQLNCDYIQGYHFSKPLPKDDFVTFIEKHLA